jgi:rhamnogalacturonyl hydrolase YesR
MKIEEKRHRMKFAHARAVSALLMLIFVCLESCQTTVDPQKWDNKKAMLMALKWQEEHPIFAKAPTDWTNGAYYTGVYKAHQSTNDDLFLDALIQMATRNEWKPWERYYHADDLTICTSYLYLKSLGIEGVDLQPTDSIIHLHLYEPHAWKEGHTDKNQQILWWWCDALFMAPPLLTAYAKMKNDPAYLDMMHKYFMETYELLFDEEENLFARDLHYVWKGDSTDVKEANGKKVFWSRGNGWVIGGLALVLDQMPADYKYRLFYEDLFKSMADRLIEIQHEDGLWRTSLLSPESFNHGEVSGSGFYTFALTWGINNGLLDREIYEPAVRKAWSALRGCQKADGMIGWVQNIGASPKPANHDSWQNYGTGAFLLAGSEILKLN